MKIALKSRRDIDQMRAAGRLVFQTLTRCREAVRPGLSTEALDQIALAAFTAADGEGLFKNYPTYEPGKGFPGNTCISVNEEVVHGIPGPRLLHQGDVVSVDCGIRLHGWCGDSAITVGVGELSPENQKLIRVAEETLQLAIASIRPGLPWSAVARKMQAHVENNGFSCVREFVGHGIGRRMHEEPKVPNFTTREFERLGDFYLQAGMVIAVEPMVIAGAPDVVVLDDGWTVVSKDGTPAAHVEHTLAVTPDGCEVLTDGT
ncbi:MAG: type I methionyl aminopeptidase [Planctomycetes bacterium]|jgi:methionyl aminopeptidase|nr:type I methionyl aminopeptidase [Planctomycetota bacterium]MDA8378209.1 type I methionyl aminopeptidase [Planctomycetia bacterium]